MMQLETRGRIAFRLLGLSYFVIFVFQLFFPSNAIPAEPFWICVTVFPSITFGLLGTAIYSRCRKNRILMMQSLFFVLMLATGSSISLLPENRDPYLQALLVFLFATIQLGITAYEIVQRRGRVFS